MFSTDVGSRRLLWKELRQLWPLAIGATVIWIFLHLNNVFAVGRSFQMAFTVSLLLGLPGVFAVGVGALLVGQEKELRTLGWLSSLPVDKKDVVRSKLLIGLLGLMAIWLVSALLALFFTIASGGDAITTQVPIAELFTFPLHSLFLLLAGLALAWRLQSAFLSLALLVPIAFLPFIASAATSTLASVLFGDGFVEFSWLQNPLFLLPSQMVGCTAAWLLGHRWGVQALGAVPSNAGTRDQDRPLGRHPGAPFRPNSALVWQFAAQNRLVLTIVIGLLLGAMVFFLAGKPMVGSISLGGWGELLIFLGYACAALAMSWLGVTVFQSDQTLRRIRFLADRGVSPATAWWTRHAVPFSFAILTVFVASFGSLVLVDNEKSSVWEFLQISLIPILAAAIIIYCMSQWIGQIFTSPIIAALAGPAVSLAAVSYLIVSLETVGTKLWLVVIAAILPILTTRIAARRWMDQCYDWKYWLTHAATLMLFLLLPMTPVLVALATKPTMSSTTRIAMEQERQRSFNSTLLQPIELALHADAENAETTEISKPRLTVEQKAAESLETLRQQIKEYKSYSFRPSQRVVDFFRSELAYARYLAEQNTANSRYNELVELAIDIIEGARRSHHLSDQEQADRMEIILVYELVYKNGRAMLQAKCLDRAASVLGDKPRRDAARRFAIAHTPELSNENPNNIASQTRGKYNILKAIVARGQLERIAELLWQLANSPNQDLNQLRSDLAAAFQYSPNQYALGAAKEYYRADDFAKYCFESRGSIWMGVGAQWNADWEQQAKSLTQPVQ